MDAEINVPYTEIWSFQRFCLWTLGLRAWPATRNSAFSFSAFSLHVVVYPFIFQHKVIYDIKFTTAMNGAVFVIWWITSRYPGFPIGLNLLQTQKLRSPMLITQSGDPFKAWSRSKYSLAYFSHCQKFLPDLISTFPVHWLFFLQILSPYFLTALVLAKTVFHVGPPNKTDHLLIITSDWAGSHS